MNFLWKVLLIVVALIATVQAQGISFDFGRQGGDGRVDGPFGTGFGGQARPPMDNYGERRESMDYDGTRGRIFMLRGDDQNGRIPLGYPA